MNKCGEEGTGKLRRRDASREGNTVRRICVSIDVTIAGDRVLENQSKPQKTVKRGRAHLVRPDKR